MRSKFPVVLCCTGIAGLNLPSVFYDDFHAAYTMTRFLLSKGLKRVGFFASGRQAMSFRGYKWALEEADCPFDPSLVVMERAMHADYDDLLKEPTELAENYLRARRNVEGVVCGFDYFAAGILRAAKKLDISVPDDLKVVGIDDFSIETEIPLTTYHVPYEKIGRRTFEILNDLTRGAQPRLLEEHIKGSIVIRESA
jgi:DNA-binding LacI/PurR family transcriptional regulator